MVVVHAGDQILLDGKERRPGRQGDVDRAAGRDDPQGLQVHRRFLACEPRLGPVDGAVPVEEKWVRDARRDAGVARVGEQRHVGADPQVAPDPYAAAGVEHRVGAIGVARIEVPLLGEVREGDVVRKIGGGGLLPSVDGEESARVPRLGHGRAGESGECAGAQKQARSRRGRRRERAGRGPRLSTSLLRHEHYPIQPQSLVRVALHRWPGANHAPYLLRHRIVP